MFVLDTDAISSLMRARANPDVVARLARVPISEQATTAVSLAEIAYGASRSGRPELFQRAVQMLSGVRVLPFDQEAAERYGQLRSALDASGQRLDDPDLRIAATTLVHGATLITGNLRHFARVPGLSVENWLRT